MPKMFQIHEDDLVALEEILPHVFSALTHKSLLDKVNSERQKTIKRILSDVRWDYGPSEEVSVISNNTTLANAVSVNYGLQQLQEQAVTLALTDDKVLICCDGRAEAAAVFDYLESIAGK